MREATLVLRMYVIVASLYPPGWGVSSGLGNTWTSMDHHKRNILLWLKNDLSCLLQWEGIWLVAR